MSPSSVTESILCPLFLMSEQQNKNMEASFAASGYFRTLGRNRISVQYIQYSIYACGGFPCGGKNDVDNVNAKQIYSYKKQPSSEYSTVSGQRKMREAISKRFKLLLRIKLKKD